MPSVTEGEPTPIPMPEPSGRSKVITCEFCECKLFAGGDVKEFSAKAKKLRDADETIASLEKDLAASGAEVSRLNSELEAVKQKIAELQPAPVADPTPIPAKKGGFFSRG